MKPLENFFKSKGIFGINHGIVYNVGDIKEVWYWDSNGKEHVIKDLPENIVTGILCFRASDGSFIILD